VVESDNIDPDLNFSEDVDNPGEDPTQQQTNVLNLVCSAIEEIVRRADEYGRRRVAQSGQPRGSSNDFEQIYQILTRVFNDAWHRMDRVRLPKDHNHKTSHFKAPRSAIFILDPGDVIRIKKVIKRRGQNWEHYLAWNLRYIAAGCRREIPPPQIFFHRIKAVFDFFSEKKIQILESHYLMNWCNK
jgi:hypothetical protein